MKLAIAAITTVLGFYALNQLAMAVVSDLRVQSLQGQCIESLITLGVERRDIEVFSPPEVSDSGYKSYCKVSANH